MRTVIGLLAVMALVAGCGGNGRDKDVVASAGDIQVTLADFHAALESITPAYRPEVATMEGRRSFANDVLNHRIILQAAEESGPPMDPRVTAALEENARSMMAGVLYREVVEGTVEVTGKDVADLYERRSENVDMSHILVGSREEADRILGNIRSGSTSFEAAAQEHSLDPSTAREGGHSGEVSWTSKAAPHQMAAFDAEVGVLTGPIETEYGYHILLVHERVPAEQLPLEELRHTLRTEVRQMKEFEAMRDFYASLCDQHSLTWNDSGLSALQDVLARDLAQDIDTIPPADRFVPSPTRDEAAQVLATFAGRDWTIGDYAAGIAKAPQTNRPTRTMNARALVAFIKRIQLHPELLHVECLARGLDTHPEVAGKNDRILEQVNLEAFHTRFTQEIDLPAGEVRAFFDSTMATNPSVFDVPERVNVLMMIHTEEDAVRAGLGRIRAGEDERIVACEVTLDFKTKYKDAETGLLARGNYAPQVEDVMFSRKPGSGWSSPIVTETGTAAVRVLEHEDARVAEFEEVEQMLTQQMAQARGESAFEEWLSARRESLGVEIHDDALQLIGKSVTGEEHDG
ncbi:MAG: peptidylprolyl isomerase [Gemmatimonadota bacterium]|nr:peptidylprolyl isomerase [Gemmatimonadota bacterium]MDP6803430.1 peptidylprolyl isomerase [Gemmatimonadota bacterium]MDP7030933.1 peptidylprolyl isomerase [Gemmatimonadota bacterium]